MSRARSIVALAAVIAVSATYLVVRDWSAYTATEDIEPTVIAAGSTGEDGGAGWGPLALDDVTALRDPEADPLPAGTRLLVATFTVRPGSEPVTCRVVSLAAADGRSWTSGSSRALPDSYDDVSLPCADPISSSTEVRALFVVPGDAESPFRLTVRTPPSGDGPAPLILLDAD